MLNKKQLNKNKILKNLKKEDPSDEDIYLYKKQNIKINNKYKIKKYKLNKILLILKKIKNKKKFRRKKILDLM